MRFAKLENNVIVAFFLAYFEDIKPLDSNGKEMKRLPLPNFNNHNAKKPVEKMFLKYKVRA
jgi:hypothetical protein